MTVAIVGAGIAGIACARALRDAGSEVVLFDKGRGIGGRIATRRIDGHGFDHGAQYATARGPSFAAALAEAATAGAAAPWPAAGDGRWVGVPGMSALPRHLAAGLQLTQGRQVGWIAPHGDGWLLRHQDAAGVAPGTVAEAGETAGPFAAVLLALPAPQAAALLAPLRPNLAARAAAATYAPCWTVMAVFNVRLDLPDVVRDRGAVGWMARESSRPGRAALPERWVIQAGPDASRAMLDHAPDAVVVALLDGLPTATSASAHRWRFAKVERAADAPCLWEDGIGACGDWCVGGRVEAAWDSGRAMAAAILASGRLTSPRAADPR